MQQNKQQKKNKLINQPFARVVFPNFSSSRPVSLVPCSATKYQGMSIK
jgi:hypothetical protein